MRLKRWGARHAASHEWVYVPLALEGPLWLLSGSCLGDAGQNGGMERGALTVTGKNNRGLSDLSQDVYIGRKPEFQLGRWTLKSVLRMCYLSDKKPGV